MTVDGADPRRKRGRRASLVALVLIAAAVLFSYYVGWWGGNVRAVVPGRFYRSAQLGPEQLEEVIRTKGIRTVLNLRGPNPTEAWWQRETSTCRRLGVDYRQIALTKSRPPTPGELNRVLRILDDAEYPVLVHCAGGADRTGLVSSLFLSVYQGVPPRQACDSQLSLFTGHIQPAAPAMRRFFEDYERTARGQDLRTWIRTNYATDFVKKQPPRAVRVAPLAPVR